MRRRQCRERLAGLLPRGKPSRVSGAALAAPSSSAPPLPHLVQGRAFNGLRYGGSSASVFRLLRPLLRAEPLGGSAVTPAAPFS